MCHIPFEVALIRLLSFIEMTRFLPKNPLVPQSTQKRKLLLWSLTSSSCMMSLELEAINDNDLGRLPVEL